MTGTRL